MVPTKPLVGLLQPLVPTPGRRGVIEKSRKTPKAKGTTVVPQLQPPPLDKGDKAAKGTSSPI